MKITNIKRCSRCGGTHKELEAKEFINSIDKFNYWASCPDTGDPILISVMLDEDRADIN